jgi:hypothetical protein
MPRLRARNVRRIVPFACSQRELAPVTSREPLILDSVTHLTDKDRGRVALCMSHGGHYAAYFAASKGVAAVILNDAGIGREQAGIAGVLYLEKLGMPAAAISHRSARIGDGKDGYARGVISYANRPAAAVGVKPGLTSKAALDILLAAGLPAASEPPAEAEHRFEAADVATDRVKIVIMDSISLVQPGDAGHVIVAASHGGLPGGKLEAAVKYPVFAAVTNDADRGIDAAGISRLPALEARGIAGACVSAFSARIGDGRSTFEDGYISALNETARRHGGEIGQSCRAFVDAMVKARAKEIG